MVGVRFDFVLPMVNGRGNGDLGAIEGFLCGAVRDRRFFGRRMWGEQRGIVQFITTMYVDDS